MASRALEEFLGDGVLKGLSGRFTEDGWDDVPTIKVITTDDMEALELNDAQRDALELRIYLHSRSLMQYADRMEASGIGIIDLMSMKRSELASKFGMRKSHIATFVDTSISCDIQFPPDPSLVPSSSRRRYSLDSRTVKDGNPMSDLLVTRPTRILSHECTASDLSWFANHPTRPPHRPSLSDTPSFGSPSAMDLPASTPCVPNASEMGYGPPSLLMPPDATKPSAPKGMLGANTNGTGRRKLGLVKAQSSGNVTKLSSLEKVMLLQLAPDLMDLDGLDPRTIKDESKPQAIKASSLWADKATLFFCIRRPGCVMCRAEAHQLFARKPIFDSLGIQLVAVLHEHIEKEVWAFWPRYWGAMIVLDEKRDFFKALGGGKLMKDNFLTEFFLNPMARLNWKRALKTGIQYSSNGEGLIKGGLYIVRKGKGGVAYQFVEKSYGDWAPLDEILQVCHFIKDGVESGVE